MPSKDLLEKLFDIEHEAEAMVTEAREEAGRRLDAAKTRAQRYYAEAYDAALAKALAAREQSDKDAREEYEEAVATYRRKLESSSLDKGSLNAICDAALEEGR
jgi:vacuolar-type H+-ATPase subunit H